jgi:hypothetical protein
MKPGSYCFALAVLALSGSAAVFADVVFLKSGGKMEGRIVERSESSVEIDIGAGTLRFPMSSVDRIEEGRSTLDDYDERAAKVAPDDRDGWLELARWASGVGLGAQSRRAYERVLALDPADSEANRALGRVQVEGQWLTEDEAYQARGYVLFEGRWVTPSEQESILRSRESERAAAQARAQTAEAQAREAEARAREAEAQADAEARRSRSQSPFYWGTWGPGPSSWPSNPLDSNQRFERRGSND